MVAKLRSLVKDKTDTDTLVLTGYGYQGPVGSWVSLIPGVPGGSSVSTPMVTRGFGSGCARFGTR